MKKNIIVGVVVLVVLAAVAFFVFRSRTGKETGTPPPAVTDETPSSPLQSSPVPVPVSSGSKPSLALTGPFLQVAYPNGSERLCMDEGVIIQWKSLGIKSVGIFLRDTRDPYLKSDYPLGIYRADASGTGTEGKGSTAWKVGFTSSGVRPPLGVSAYKILIKGDTGTTVLEDTSDRAFTIAECQ